MVNGNENPEVVRAFHHEENVTWTQSEWPKLWSLALRRVFDEKIEARANDVVLRAELLELMSIANQVIIKNLSLFTL